jgi:CSLREA domain-containing protein
LTVVLSGRAYAATLVVNTTADTFDGVCNAADCSLKDAVYEAEQNGQPDDIVLQEYATYLISTLYSNTLNAVPVINTQINVIGHGATLKRDPSLGVLRYFRVMATGQLSLENLTLRDGFFPGNEYGGAIRSDGQVTADNCNFVNNKMPTFGTQGGAIYNNGGTLQLTRSSFIGNTATNGGAVCTDGFPALPQTVIIDGCTFQGNKALTVGYSSGGALFMRGATNATITDSTFIGNSSDTVGGAISFHTIPLAYTVDLVNLTIAGNTAIGDSGGLYAHTCTDQNCPIVTKPRLTNVILANNLGAANNPNCTGGFFSVGHNIIGWPNGSCLVTSPTNPPDYLVSTLTGLAPTVDTGDAGGLFTPPIATCQAVDTGDAGFCAPLDQVSFDRRGASCEIGAIEYRACIPPPADLVDWWTFDEISGPAAYDIAGVGLNHGLYLNGVTSTPQGMVARAHCFNGVNQRMTVQDHAELDFAGDCAQGPADPFTIDAWMKTAASGRRPIIDKRESAANFLRGYELFIENGQLGFEMANGPGNSLCGTVGSACTDYLAPPVGSGGVDLADNRWHHVAVVVSRCPTALGELYIDGTVAQTFMPMTGDLANAAGVLIADAYPVNVTNPPFHGCLDEIEIFKRALGATEIQALYQAGWTGKCKPLFTGTGSSPVGTCVTGMHKGVTIVGTATGKVVRGCVKDGAAAKLGGMTAQACLTADRDGKVAKATARTTLVESSKCNGVMTAVGPTSVESANTATVEEELGLAADVFGADLDAVLALKSADPAAAKCQDAVVKGYQKLVDAKLEVFVACSKHLFKSGTADAATLASCVSDGTQPDSIATSASQPGGKVAVATAKLASTIAKTCAGVDIATRFPNRCSTASATTLGQCVDVRVECRVCRMLSHAGRLQVDCDAFDDGVANGSCAA